MTIGHNYTGVVETSDLQTLLIVRNADGTLTATVTYKVGIDESRTANWTLSGAEKAAIGASLVPGAKAAIAAALGL